jgi:predicted hotdog family 3-hydroxylacyl-ACP dehydratase
MTPHSLVTDLIPHRGSALLLDRILDLSSTRCLALARVAPGAWYLQPDGHAPAWVGLEWMAQTASAFSGHRHKLAGREPRVGFLLGTRSYEAIVPSFPIGWEVEVEAQVIFLDETGLGAFSCALRHSGETLAHAKLKAIEIP